MNQSVESTSIVGRKNSREARRTPSSTRTLIKAATVGRLPSTKPNPSVASKKILMAAPQISAITFHRQFSRFTRLVEKSSGESFASFREGLPFEWEDYKGPLRVQALRFLQIQRWKRKEIGTGRILNDTIAAIEIKQPAGGVKNNLVRWENRYGEDSQSHRMILDAVDDVATRRSLEHWLYHFYNNHLNDGPAFEEFIALTGRRYDLIAYLYFLKDWTRFMPIATKTFDKAFELLGIDLKTNQQCSWENYSAFNAALRSVQKCLHEFAGIKGARLIDAHSFCWMLVRLPLPDSEPAPKIPLPIQLTNIGPMNSKDRRDNDLVDGKVVTPEEFAALDAKRRRLGSLAQDIALQAEQRRLENLGHANPLSAVQPVWNEPNRGYDILSCEIDGSPRCIEVKAVQHSGGRLSFILSDHEWRKSRELSNYQFYLVVNPDSQKPKVWMASSDEILAEFLRPLDYRVSFSSEIRP